MMGTVICRDRELARSPVFLSLSLFSLPSPPSNPLPSCAFTELPLLLDDATAGYWMHEKRMDGQSDRSTYRQTKPCHVPFSSYTRLTIQTHYSKVAFAICTYEFTANVLSCCQHNYDCSLLRPTHHCGMLCIKIGQRYPSQT